MHTRSKLMLAALATAALLAYAVNTASATHIRILNSERGTRIVWTPITFETGNGNNAIRCNLTLEGTFRARTFAKTAALQIGNLTRATVGTGCTGGTVRALTETLPWPIQYGGSFTGTLPAITTINLSFIAMALAIAPSSGLGPCLFRTEAGNPAKGIANLSEAGGGLRRIDSLRAEEATEIPLTGGFLESCRLAKGHYSGTGTATVLGETAKTIVTLI